MGLANCPVEIFLQILENVSPDDIANFAFTCRRIRKLAADRLQEHEWLRSEFTTLHAGYRFGRVINTLRNIWEHRRLRYYVKVLKFTQRENVSTVITPGARSLAVQILRASPYTNHKPNLPALLDAFLAAPKNNSVRQVEQWTHAILGLLVSLLPNLETLQVEVGDIGDGFLPKFLSTIQRSNAQDASLPALRKLRDLTVLSHYPDQSLEAISPLLATPTLRTVHLAHFQSDPTCIPNVPATNAITDLKATACDFFQGSGYNFFPHLRRLRVESSFMGTSTPAELRTVDGIVTGLERWSDGGLEVLELVGACRGVRRRITEILPSLKALKVIYIEDDQLIGPESVDPSDPEVSFVTEEKVAEWTPWLVDVLPASAEYVTLDLVAYGPFVKPFLETLFSAFEEEKVVKCPNLRVIRVGMVPVSVFGPGAEWLCWIRDSCARVGVHFFAHSGCVGA